jgi:hypothetical protein
MARGAAPEAIARDADVLVLGRQGYETAVRGKNGFVCVVERSWMSAFDFPEFWNPQLRGPICFNPPTARFRGGEQFLGAYAYLDVTPKGRNENGPYHSLGDWVRPKNMYGKGGIVEGNGRYHAPGCACAVHK